MICAGFRCRGDHSPVTDGVPPSGRRDDAPHIWRCSINWYDFSCLKNYVFMSTKNHTIPRYEATLYKIKIFKKWQNVKKKNAISVKIAATTINMRGFYSLNWLLSWYFYINNSAYDLNTGIWLKIFKHHIFLLITICFFYNAIENWMFDF